MFSSVFFLKVDNSQPQITVVAPPLEDPPSATPASPEWLIATSPTLAPSKEPGLNCCEGDEAPPPRRAFNQEAQAQELRFPSPSHITHSAAAFPHLTPVGSRGSRGGSTRASFAALVDDLIPVLEDGAADISRLTNANLLQIDARLIATAVDGQSHDQFAADVLERASFAEYERELQAGAPEEHGLLLTWPTEGSVKEKIGYILTIPLDLIFSLTMRHDPGWWFITIPSAILWLAVLAASLDEAGGIICCTLGIDTILLGETVIAAGTSMPNVLAAILAGRKGQVDTATSQAFGSNTFDILMAFAGPYLAKVIVNGGQPVAIDAGGAVRDGFVCLGVLFLYIIILVYNRWRLTKFVGWTFISMYLAYIAYVFVENLVGI